MAADWLGSPQHLVGRAVLGLAVVLAAARRVRPAWVLAVLAVGVVAIAEIAVEVVEYPLLYADAVSQTAYLDTDVDLATTLVGGVLGVAAGLLGLRRRGAPAR